MGGVDDVAGAGGQGVSPGQLCSRTGGDGDDGRGGSGWVGAAVADDVGGGYVVDGLE